MSRASAAYVGLVARLRCVVCARGFATPETAGLPVEVHHVAKGSSLRSDFAIAPLCSEHHRGGSGLHGMGEKPFVRLYRPPLDDELGLLAWTAEDLAKSLVARGIV